MASAPIIPDKQISESLYLKLHTIPFQEMQIDAEKRFPNEACGFFYGKSGNPRDILAVLPISNSKEGDQRRRFEINPLDYLKAEQYAEEHQLDLLGIYHSHPNHPAIPSIHDFNQAVPHFSYIILSVQEGTFDHIRSWRLTEDFSQFQEEEIIHHPIQN